MIWVKHDVRSPLPFREGWPKAGVGLANHQAPSAEQNHV
jgi:hypothetical protein